MIDPNRWLHVCRRPVDIPDACRTLVRPEIAQRLGGTVGELFPDLARAMPETVAAMERHGSRPTLLFKQVLGTDWLTGLVVEQPHRDLFFNVNGIARRPREGPEFELAFRMLPAAWQALYRDFDSFEITSAGHMSITWTNTPFPLNGRLVAARLGNASGLKTANLLAFARRIGADPFDLSCWCVTPGLGDMLWVDGGRTDGRVHHVSRCDFDGAVVLADPAERLDRYLAGLVGVDPPGAFDFRGS